MSSSSTGFASISLPWVATLIVLIAALAIWHLLRARKRKDKMKKYAKNHHLAYLDSAIPASLCLERLSFWRPSDTVENMMMGKFRNKEVAFFDLRANRGKQTSIQTAVAFRTDDRLQRFEDSGSPNSRLFVEGTGDWIVYFVYRELLEPYALQGLLADAELHSGSAKQARSRE
jgi:hypothetical protein